ncbi:MAG: hypothetical protein WCA78_04670 [Rhizomicrobium sp.]
MGTLRIARYWAFLFIASLAVLLLIGTARMFTQTRNFPPITSRSRTIVMSASKQATPEPPSLAMLVSLGALLVTGMGTASTIVLGWRNEKRQAMEFKLKIEQLELQLAEAKAKALAANSVVGDANKDASHISPTP